MLQSSLRAILLRSKRQHGFYWAVLLVLFIVLILSKTSLVPTGNNPFPTARYSSGTSLYRDWVSMPDELVFITLGDWGGGGRGQKMVGKVLEKVCRVLKPQFIVSLGDNFYDDGVRSVRDPKFSKYFETIYTGSTLDLPWYILLGDHDHKGSVDALVQYSNISKRWVFPAPYYEFKTGGGGKPVVQIIAVDSVGLEGALTIPTDKRRFAGSYTPKYTDKKAGEDQIKWLRNQLNASRTGKGQGTRNTSEPHLDWVIVAGHRPILTAGIRDRTSSENRTADFLRSLLTEAGPANEMKGSNTGSSSTNPRAKSSAVDLYINGHDHTQQHLHDGNLHYIVNGAGGYRKLHPFVNIPESKYSASHYGFCVHRITKNSIHTDFINAQKEIIDHTTVISKP